MPDKKTDPRTAKTRRAIFEALAELLTEKELRKVTVHDISERAQINRVTFYNHFLDVYDLNDKLETGILTEMGMLMLRMQELPSGEIMSALIDYADSNRPVFRLIFSPNVTVQLRTKFERLFEGVFRQTQAEKQNSDIRDTLLEYRCCYRSHGCLAVLERWVRGDFSEPKAFVLEALSGLDRNTEDYLLAN
ncbi:MAG: TetR/AcrR family transcriptional regulator C-terminal domain-containing protein [Ruminococcus sp.]|nr:TetR/AcrR family transcriptional regulator C-terminal domain-containing protein [Ruminococcus sp.]